MRLREEWCALIGWAVSGRARPADAKMILRQFVLDFLTHHPPIDQYHGTIDLFSSLE